MLWDLYRFWVVILKQVLDRGKKLIDKVGLVQAIFAKAILYNKRIENCYEK